MASSPNPDVHLAVPFTVLPSSVTVKKVVTLIGLSATRGTPGGVNQVMLACSVESTCAALKPIPTKSMCKIDPSLST